MAAPGGQAGAGLSLRGNPVRGSGVGAVSLDLNSAILPSLRAGTEVRFDAPGSALPGGAARAVSAQGQAAGIALPDPARMAPVLRSQAASPASFAETAVRREGAVSSIGKGSAMKDASDEASLRSLLSDRRAAALPAAEIGAMNASGAREAGVSMMDRVLGLRSFSGKAAVDAAAGEVKAPASGLNVSQEQRRLDEPQRSAVEDLKTPETNVAPSSARGKGWGIVKSAASVVSAAAAVYGLQALAVSLLPAVFGVVPVAALWAVLTRLKRPESDHFPEPAGRLLARLSPLEKARLYDHTATPEWCSEEERRLVLGNLKALLEEFDDQEEEFEGVVEPAYEGRRGASPRETLTLLSEAASDPLHSCLSPLAILRTIKEFVKETSVFDFLRLPAQGAYHNQDSLLELVREEYYRIVLEEIRDAIGLVDEAQYLRLFQDYFVHVKAYARGEKVRNSSTKNLEDPSESVMQEVERVLQPKEPVEGFRKGLITRIAAYSLDHPEIPLDYKNVFPEIFRAIKEDFFHQREHALSTAHANFLKLGTPEFAGLDAERRREVENAMVRMRERHGYCEHCAKEVIAFVSRWENKEA